MRRLAWVAVAVLLGAASAPLVAITGSVAAPAALTLSALAAMPAVTVDAGFGTMHGTEHHAWSGPLLWDLLQNARLVDAAGKRSFAQHTILVRGQDGYAAALAIGEIAPGLEGKRVILAVRDETGALAAPRLIVPGDAHGARAVQRVSGIEVR